MLAKITGVRSNSASENETSGKHSQANISFTGFAFTSSRGWLR